MHTSLVAMFCGPHDNNGGVSFRRIDAAIDAANSLRLPLVICGDGNGGVDCRLFHLRARSYGALNTVALYDAGASTLHDARLLVALLRKSPEFTHVECVHLATDWWHMSRARLFLEYLLLEQMPSRRVRVEALNVSCFAPPQRVLDREQRGIEDFQAGRYGREPTADHYGKPVPGRRIYVT